MAEPADSSAEIRSDSDFDFDLGPTESEILEQERYAAAINRRKAPQQKGKKITFPDEVEDKKPTLPPRKDSVAPPPPDKRPEWYQEMSEQQINMFKEVFEMLDKDGGGSIDSEELYSLMKELDIDVSLEEIKNVLKDLDQDGNGEIDFDEFLYCMAEGIFDPSGGPKTSASASGTYNKRQTLFFTAITRFAIKNSLGEIERYYASKVNKAPHVISCYTAGVRLIGLNDRQLEQEIRRMQKAARKHTSPYAKPLPFVTVKPKKKKPKKKEPEAVPASTPAPAPAPAPTCAPEPVEESDGLPQVIETLLMCNSGEELNISSSAFDSITDEHIGRMRRAAITPDDLEVLNTLKNLRDKGNIVAKIPDIHLVPQIRSKLAKGDIDEPICSSVRKRRRTLLEMGNNGDKKSKDPTGSAKRQDRHPQSGPRGWVIPRMERGQAPLPVIKLSDGNIQKTFTIEDVPDIRKWVSESLDVYYSTLKKAHVKTAWTHWKQLHTDQIKSKHTRELFRRVYMAYSPHEEDQVFAISPWIPGRWYFKRTSNNNNSWMAASSSPQEQLIGSHYSKTGGPRSGRAPVYRTCLAPALPTYPRAAQQYSGSCYGRSRTPTPGPSSHPPSRPASRLARPISR